MKRCIIFSRVSTLHQTLEQQTEALVAEAVRLGYDKNSQIKLEYKESAIKLDVDERQGIQKLMQTIEENPDVDCVICWELSRIARRADVIFTVRDFFVSHQIQWIVMTPYMRLLDDDKKMTPTASITLSVFTALTENEMVLKKERLARGRLAKQKRGFWTGGYLPFGYSKDENNLIVVDEHDGEVVREIFDMYVNQKLGLRTIAMMMNDRGEMVSKGEFISTGISTIGKMLSNTAYIGISPKSSKHETAVNNVYPPIVTKELFDAAQVQKILNTNSPRHRTETKYLCKGIVKDMHTGKTLSGKPAMNSYRLVIQKYEDEVSYNSSAPINLVDSVVWKLVKDFRSKTMPIENDRMIADLKSRVSVIRRKIRQCERKEADLNNQVLKINERIVSGKLREVVGDAMLDSIDNQIAENRDSIINYTLEIKGLSDRIQKVKADKNINMDSITSYSEMSQIIHETVTSVEIDSQAAGSINVKDMTVNFIDGSFEMLRFNPFNRRVWSRLDGEEIKYDYIEIATVRKRAR